MYKIELFGLKKYKIIILGITLLILILASIFYYLQWQNKKENNNLETCISAARHKFTTDLNTKHKEKYPDDESCKSDPVGCYQSNKYIFEEFQKSENKCNQIYQSASDRKAKTDLELCLKRAKETIEQIPTNEIPLVSLESLNAFCYKMYPE